MRKVVIAQFLTLDGVSQAPGGVEEDPEGGFAYGGWQMQYLNADDSEVMTPLFDNMGAMLLGRKTYDIFADYWPHAGDGQQDLVAPEDASLAALMNSVPIYVASHSDTLKPWDNGDVTHLGTDLPADINALKQQPGKDIIVWGSGDFAQTLMRESLIDNYFLMIHPLVLGTGKKLFRSDSPHQDLQLTSSQTTKSGVLVLTYSVKK